MTRVSIDHAKASGLVTIKDKDGNVKAELELTSVEVKRPEELSEETNDEINHDSHRSDAGCA